MTDPLIFRIISACIVVVGLLFLALFIREPWRKNLYGWAVMEFAIGLVLFAAAATLRNFLGPDYPGRHVVRVAANGLVLIALISQTWVLWQAQRGTRRSQLSDNELEES